MAALADTGNDETARAGALHGIDRFDRSGEIFIHAVGQQRETVDFGFENALRGIDIALGSLFIEGNLFHLRRCVHDRYRGSVGEEINVGPASEIKIGAGLEGIEHGLREGGAAFAFEHHVELGAYFMQVQDVACRINALFFGEVVGTPVG
jgi:hypothetical protein